jgi:hypothetical protein
MGKKNVKNRLKAKGIDEQTVHSLTRTEVDTSSVKSVADESLFIVDADPSLENDGVSHVSWKDRLKIKKLKSHALLDDLKARAIEPVVSKRKKPVILSKSHVEELFDAQEKTRQAIEAQRQKQVLTGDVWAPDSFSSNCEIPLKPSQRPAVPVPSGGVSYNPVAEEHAQVLTKAYGQEKRRLRQQKRFRDALAVPDSVYKYSGDDVLEGLRVDAMPDESDAVQDSEPEKKAARRVRRTERNKEKDKRLRKIAEMKQRARESRLRKIDRIFTIASEMNRIDVDRACKANQKRIAKEARKGVRIIAASRAKNTVHDRVLLDVPLTEDLSNGSMRTIKGSSLLLKDRLSSLQMRNLVEATSKQKPLRPRYHPIVFERKTLADTMRQ